MGKRYRISFDAPIIPINCKLPRPGPTRYRYTLFPPCNRKSGNLINLSPGGRVNFIETMTKLLVWSLSLKSSNSARYASSLSLLCLSSTKERIEPKRKEKKEKKILRRYRDEQTGLSSPFVRFKIREKEKVRWTIIVKRIPRDWPRFNCCAIAFRRIPIRLGRDTPG